MSKEVERGIQATLRVPGASPVGVPSESKDPRGLECEGKAAAGQRPPGAARGVISRSTTAAKEKLLEKGLLDSYPSHGTLHQISAPGTRLRIGVLTLNHTPQECMPGLGAQPAGKCALLCFICKIGTWLLLDQASAGPVNLRP